MQILLSCNLSGIPLGVLSTAFPSSFLATRVTHPAFSSSLLSNASHLTSALKSGELDSLESRVSFLATIHKLTSVRQDFAGLPSPELVELWGSSLLTLVDWKLRVPNLSYPTLHISKVNSGFDCLENWILTSEDIRDSAKHRLAELEAKTLAELENSRNALALSGTPSLTKLYSWISTLLRGTQYEPDSIGWLRTLFLAKDSNAILYFTKDEIAFGCEIIESHLPLGTGLGPSVRRRLATLRETIGSYYLDLDELERSFEEESEDTFLKRTEIRTQLLEKLTSEAPPEPPKLSEYPNQIAYTIALSKWKLANRKLPAKS